MNGIERLSKEIAKATKGSKTKPYDTKGIVRSVKDGKAMVHFYGGVDETPVDLTINAKVGDEVVVRASGGRAFIVGNGSAPPTDDTKAEQVERKLDRATQVIDGDLRKVYKGVGDLNTLVRESADGVEVGKVNSQGEYVAGHTLIDAGDNRYKVIDDNGVVNAYFGDESRIGSEDGMHIDFDESGMAMLDGTRENFRITQLTMDVEKTVEVASYSDSSEVTTATLTVTDSAIKNNAVSLEVNADGTKYPLSSEHFTYTVYAGSRCTVSLTSSGVSYVQGLVSSATEACVLSVTYTATYSNQTEMVMHGGIVLDHFGNSIVDIRNSKWTESNKSDTMIRTRNMTTKYSTKYGVGIGGYNRGIWDDVSGKWMIYSDANLQTRIWTRPDTHLLVNNKPVVEVRSASESIPLPTGFTEFGVGCGVIEGKKCVAVGHVNISGTNSAYVHLCGFYVGDAMNGTIVVRVRNNYSATVSATISVKGIYV